MRSLHHHASLRQGLRANRPVDTARIALLSRARQYFEAATWSIPDDFFQRSHFDRILATKIDWTSSPGYPYLMRAPTNGIFFRVVDGSPSSEAADHVWEIIQDRIREGDADPIRLFIKPEPHSSRKLEEGRYRLISSVSVVDQIIDHMLFGEMNQKLCDNWMDTPVRTGWNEKWGGWRAMPRAKWLACDKTSWDWTVHVWMIEMVLELRASLCQTGGPLLARWMELATWRYKCLYVNAQIITSGGLIMRQVTPGVMKSGCVNTISDNSIMQVLLHLRVCLETDQPPGWLLAMGDDTLQEPPADLSSYIDQLEQYCILKSWKYENEFAGMRFLGRRIEPLYRGKHSYIMLHVDPAVLPQLALSYSLLYHRSAYRPVIEDVFHKMGVQVLSRADRDLIMDGY